MEPVNEEALPPRGQQLGKRMSLDSLLSAARDQYPPSASVSAVAPDATATQSETTDNSGSTDDIRSSSSLSKPADGVVPPYWRHSRAASRASHISLESSPGHLITLEDHSEDPACDTNRGLWAKGVTIDDHVVVKGTTGIGAYVVWNCKIQTLEVGCIPLCLRCKEDVH